MCSGAGANYPRTNQKGDCSGKDCLDMGNLHRTIMLIRHWSLFVNLTQTFSNRFCDILISHDNAFSFLIYISIIETFLSWSNRVSCFLWPHYIYFKVCSNIKYFTNSISQRGRGLLNPKKLSDFWRPLNIYIYWNVQRWLYLS